MSQPQERPTTADGGFEISEETLEEYQRHALWHVSQGRSVIPIRRKGSQKVGSVLWKCYQTKLPRPFDAERWFRKRNGLIVDGMAMILGPVSGGLWVLDCDGQGAVSWAESNAPPTGARSLTRHGKHLYYRTPAGTGIRNDVNILPELNSLAPPGGKCQLDVRGDGGMIVLPPTVHATGRYEWESCDWGSVPVWEPPFRSQGGPWQPQGPLQPQGARQPSQRKRRPEEVWEGERNDTLASVVGRWIREGKSKEELEMLALGWNRKCRSPQPEQDVRTTMASVVRTHERKTGQVVRLTAQPMEPPPEPPRRPPEEAEPPARLLSPGGVLEEFMEYVEKGFPTHLSLFSMGAGICLLGTLMGNKVMTETGLRTNFYVIGLARSGAGKDPPLSAISNILSQTGIEEKVMGPTTLASTAALWTQVSAKKSLLLPVDEIGDVIGRSSNKNDVNRGGLTQDLKLLYSRAGKPVIKSYASGANDLNVPWQHLSMYGTGTPGPFWRNLTMSDVMDGFVSRAIILSLKRKVPKKRRDLMLDPPPGLVARVKALHDLPRPDGGNLGNFPRPWKIGKTPEAMEYFVAWEDGWTDRQNEIEDEYDGASGVYSRVGEHGHKLALISAVNRAGGVPREVALEDVLWACALMDWVTPRTVRAIRDNVAFNPQDALRRRVLAQVDTKGSVTTKDIYRAIEDCNSKQVDDAIKILELSGELGRKRFSVPGCEGQGEERWYRPDKKGAGADA